METEITGKILHTRQIEEKDLLKMNKKQLLKLYQAINLQPEPRAGKQMLIDDILDHLDPKGIY